ncbi:MAG: hypothetical protein NTX57_05415 [Armatimonadetes bacterium]|nr:hypothetical protein [Armatimonadota bacterium]
MWQRFTEETRRVVFYAQEEAVQRGESFVDTEHLLLGALREPQGAPNHILERLGVSPADVCMELTKQMHLEANRSGPELQLADKAKRAIDLAFMETRQLRHNDVKPEHLMLGLLREENGLAGQVLSQFNVGLEQARQEVVLQQQAKPSLKAHDLFFRMFSRPAMKEPPSEP